MKLLGDLVFVTAKPREQKTPGGLIIPETAAGRRYIEGVVVEVGIGLRNIDTGLLIPNDVAKGDRVVFGVDKARQYVTIEVEGKMENLILLRQGDIVAVL
jgi:chaperonin GroES